MKPQICEERVVRDATDCSQLLLVGAEIPKSAAYLTHHTYYRDFPALDSTCKEEAMTNCETLFPTSGLAFNLTQSSSDLREKEALFMALR